MVDIKNETELVKLQGDRLQTRRAIFTDERPILRGNQGAKYYAELNLEGSNKKIPVVVKSVESEEEAHRQIRLINEMEMNGLPVPQTRRYFKDGRRHCIVFSDLSQRGKALVWSMSDDLSNLRNFNLNTRDLEDIKEQVRIIYEKAKGKFFIGFDAYFLVKRNLGNGESDSKVMLGDFGRVYSKKDPSPGSDLVKEYEEKGFRGAENTFIAFIQNSLL